MKTPLLAAVLLVATTAFAAGRPIAPRPLLPWTEAVANLEVASASGRFLTAWSEEQGERIAIYGTISDENGHSTSPLPFLVAETTDLWNGVLAVTGTGDSFAVFYTNAANQVFLTDVSLDGVVLRTRALDLPTTVHMSVAWNGEHFLAANFRESFYRNRAVATLLDRDGTVVRGDIALDPFATVSHTAVTDEGFLVFTSGRDHFAHLIGEDGSVRQIIAGDRASHFLSAPLGNGRLLVVYTMYDGHVRAAIWNNGAKLSDHEIVRDDRFRPVGLMAGDGGHLIVFEASDALFAFSIDDHGTPLSEPQLVQSAGVHRTGNGATNGIVLFVPFRQSGDWERAILTSVAVKADRNTVANEPLTYRPAIQSHVLVGAGGGSMLAVWNEQTPATDRTRVLAAVIDRNLDPENTREIAPTGELALRKIAWNGTEFLIVYRGRIETLLAARVSHDGRLIGEPTLLAESGNPVRAAVAWAGDRWAIAWTSTYGESAVHYRTLSRSGIASREQTLPITNNLAFDVALAFDGRNLHLAWIETAGPWSIEPPPQGHAVFTTRLRRTGRIIDAAPSQLPVVSPQRLAIACSSEHLVVLVDTFAETTAHVLSTNTYERLATRTLFDGILLSDVTWDGWEFVAAATEYAPNGPSFLRIWRLGDDGMTTEDPRIAPTLVREDRRVSIAATPSYGAVAAMQESDAASGERAVIHAEREMYRLPHP